jgi:hypothetical protein
MHAQPQPLQRSPCATAPIATVRCTTSCIRSRLCTIDFAKRNRVCYCFFTPRKFTSQSRRDHSNWVLVLFRLCDLSLKSVIVGGQHSLFFFLPFFSCCHPKPNLPLELLCDLTSTYGYTPIPRFNLVPTPHHPILFSTHSSSIQPH